MSIFRIYKLTLAATGKFYIGQTTQRLWRRRRAHIDSARGKCWKSPLHLDILTYGAKALAIELLEECLTQETADAAEQRWIRQFNTLAPQGYNLQSGGLHAPATERSKEYMRNRVVSEETRSKLSQSASRREVTPGQLEALDRGRRKRGRNFKGEKNARHLLTENQVLEIRRRWDYRFRNPVTQVQLAAEYQISPSAVSHIVNRISWRHLLPSEY